MKKWLFACILLITVLSGCRQERKKTAVDAVDYGTLTDILKTMRLEPHE